MYYFVHLPFCHDAHVSAYRDEHPNVTLIGLDAVEKKFGQGKIDPVKQRGMNEKITDGLRGMFEKATVSHFLNELVPSVFRQ